MKASEANGLAAFVRNGVGTQGNVPDPVSCKLLDALPVAICLTDPGGVLTYSNPAAIKLAGRVPSIGTDSWCTAWNLILADGTSLQHADCSQTLLLLEEDAPAPLEAIIERPDGSRRWVILNTVAIENDAQIIGFINILTDIHSQKTAEFRAREQFEALVETSPECIAIIAADGTLRFINASGAATLGASSLEGIVGHSMYDFVAPEHRERFQAFNESVCHGERSSIQFDMIGLTGDRHQMEIYASPMRQVDGTDCHLAIAHDVTNRNRAEQSAQLLASIVDSSDDAIISKDLNSIITTFNKSAERVFGYTAEEIVGRPVTLLIPEDRQDEEPQILARLRAGERVDHFETVRVHKNGSLLDISLTISPVKDSFGRVIGASKIARDISDRKRNEAELKRSEERFRQLADLGPQIVWLSGPQGELEFVNQRWIDFSGLDLAATKDIRQIELCLHPDDRVLDHWNRSVQLGQPFELEARLRSKDGEFRWFMMRSVPIIDHDGQILRWFGTSTDIHQNKMLQLQLQRANQDLEQFAYSASHDLKEPVRGVKIFSELLASRYGDKLEGKAAEFLDHVRTSASRVEMLVNDLLVYTQTALIDQADEMTEANASVQEALANLAGAIAEAGAVIQCAVLPAVRVQATPLQQLFQNLIGNAVKYRRPGIRPLVRVEGRREGNQALFSVSDNGIGIHPEYKERIFGLFKRLHSSDEYAGTGIGLALCQRIVERHHGRIWVESEPGKGSTFYFTLPV